MTRKCVLCKETNYKNTYSFFSAPKDPETRKKWQDAIGIKNYLVNDDTYVCSKHFYKNDIITHWVSGVPPHVITIKYKKCRLRPGAVPNKNVHDLSNVQNTEDDCSDVHKVNRHDFLENQSTLLEGTLEKGQTYLIPRQENKSINESETSDKTDTSYKITSESDDYEYINNDQTDSKEMQRNTGFVAQKDIVRQLPQASHETESNTNDKYESSQEQEDPVEKFSPEETDKSFNDDTSIYYLDICNSLKNEDIRMTDSWNESQLEDHISFGREKETNGTLIETCARNQTLNNVKDYDDDDEDSIGNKADNDNILFEDLLEICTEAALPPGWTCMVTSKGHSTTIVYLFMAMTKSGMPFTERQVFINSDMTLRCTITNREINILHHNLLKDDKRNKVRSLMDVEEFIDEFDQRIICEGVHKSEEEMQEMQVPRFAYNDGINLRHVSCPLIVNNDSSRCSKCIALSRVMSQRSKTLSTLFLPTDYNAFDSKRQRRRTRLQRIGKRVRESDRRYEFVMKLKRE